MGKHKRSFEETTVIATGFQPRQHRFGREDRTPTASQWRCNLTGLSSSNNLYFVGYSTQIYVYVPHFSTQALPRQPALILSSCPSRAGLQGYLDSRCPHSINNLVVQFLGNEEVVAVVRDDGDVDAFLVRHIIQAIERRAEFDSTVGPDADEVRPMFQGNVGMSAWGLAIHSQARILAVSANTHGVTIFKFGLVGVHSEDATETLESREMDVTHHVINGQSNIPHIAFCNTGDDPNGRWLLTTDISGFCRAIDLNTMQAAQTFRFGRTLSYLSSHDRFNSGWAVMFLDRRAFLPESSVEAALGLEHGESLPGLKENSSLWDIGDTVAHIPDCSSVFILNKKGRKHGRGRRSGVTSPDSPSRSRPDSQINNEDVVSPGSMADASADTDTTEVDDDVSEGEISMDFAYSDLDVDDEGTEESSPFSAIYDGRRIYGNSPRALQSQENICDDLPCPILHASVRSCYLVQPSSKSRPLNPFPAPTVGFTNALHQLVQGEYAWLNVYERLNMNAYIPAIGIVVLASQKGRALVISLTKLSKSVPSPAEPGEDRKTKYAMRLERILPFGYQENQNQRPFAPLLGVAHGPLQGSEHLPEHKKRWRLMLTYADHSVLSYELSRPRARDSTADPHTILV